MADAAGDLAGAEDAWGDADPSGAAADRGGNLAAFGGCGLAQAVEGDRPPELVDDGLVARPGLGWQGRLAPPCAGVALDLEAEFLGEVAVALVVVAPVAAGVRDVAGEREGVSGLVQGGGEHVDRPAGEAFAGDQQLVPQRAVAVGGFPPVGGEVAE